MPEERSSRIAGFYNLDFNARLRLLTEWAALNAEEQTTLSGALGLNVERGAHMIENVAGIYGLPLGIATNFKVNGRDVLVPMVIEEPSVVAGASLAAKLARAGGGFSASTDSPVMIGQLQVVDLDDLEVARAQILEEKEPLLALAHAVDPVLVRLGGGARDLEVRLLPETAAGPMLIVHLLYDVRDAMGANAINTACERLAPEIERLTGGKVFLRILSNLADQRLARAEVSIPESALAFNDFTGEAVAAGIEKAWAFAAADPYRATTHNKGIMNGIDAVVIATGNDWRAIEAGAHAYAARNGRYTSLSTWQRDNQGHLNGKLELPLALGIVGGATRVHPTAQVALKILGVQTARELAEIVASVGLAQNLAAIRALATEGIQKGHMDLHARQVAMAAGATGEAIERIAQAMIAEGVIRVDRATALLALL
ncbi:MAG: hydroxymethylglutaryl-CoA reductase, degradative [Anaerolineae bacterium]|jgi:hydroxymethylglutaryl-CoA reductase|nr:hydroxymethylglutaryl-CoA reductase, degradative [Anaerolineae bacterium]